MASMAGDIGHGIFDGAYLVNNFENLNPSNTYWSKLYNLYAKVDTEGERFLEFEKWWGGHYLMNKEEMEWISQNLFVGNKLSSGQVESFDGKHRVDLRNIRTPMIVFASWGDNITPPQQALNWIADLYDSVDDIRLNEQTIVYCLHEKIGHLGIFVSAGVAQRETSELASALELIDTLPQVQFWIRNLANRPQTSFWLPTSTDRFYPDFVAMLKDGRIFAIEYKGAHLADSPDTLEKTTIGQLWAAKSQGKALFLMAEQKDAQGHGLAPFDKRNGVGTGAADIMIEVDDG